MKKIIRGWLPSVFILAGLFVLCTCAGAKKKVVTLETADSGSTETEAGFTWEGELDPNEFDKWEKIFVSPGPRIGTAWVFIKNPDYGSPIEIVALQIKFEGYLLAYRYFKDGEPYVYVFNGKDKYVQLDLSNEQRRSCMECHTKAEKGDFNI